MFVAAKAKLKNDQEVSFSWIKILKIEKCLMKIIEKNDWYKMLSSEQKM